MKFPNSPNLLRPFADSVQPISMGNPYLMQRKECLATRLSGHVGASIDALLGKFANGTVSMKLQVSS